MKIIIYILSCLLFFTSCGKEKNTSANNEKILRLATDSAVTAKLCYELDIPLVGVPISQHNIPAELNHLPKIGRAAAPDYEKIIDLGINQIVSTTFIKPSTQMKYKELSIPVIYLSFHSYEDTKDTIKLLGDTFNRKEKAEEILADIQKREDIIKEKVKDKPRKRVAMIYGYDNRYSLAGEKHYVNSLLKILNCDNVASDIQNKLFTKGLIPIDLEALIELNPDIILRLYIGKNPMSKENFDREFNSNSPLKETTAFKNGMIIEADPDLLRMSPGVNCIDSLEKLYKYIYEGAVAY